MINVSNHLGLEGSLLGKMQLCSLLSEVSEMTFTVDMRDELKDEELRGETSRTEWSNT